MSGGQILDKVPFFFSERQFYRNIFSTLHIVMRIHVCFRSFIEPETSSVGSCDSFVGTQMKAS